MTLGPRLSTLAIALALSATSPTPDALAQAPSVQGLWRSGDTTMRIAVDKGEVKGTFVEVGAAARELGFKPGEQSFVASMTANYLTGRQTIRYGATCHPGGRQVPMIGRLTPNGQALALHYYNIRVDPSCRDTGQYNVAESLWQRAPGR